MDCYEPFLQQISWRCVLAEAISLFAISPTAGRPSRAFERSSGTMEKSPRVDCSGERAAEAEALFSDEEVGQISGLKMWDDYVEVTCGCTSHRYGDAVGKLRVFPSGELGIICECTPGCQEGNMTPAAFEKHSGRETARKWKNNIWVIVNGVKVPLLKTALLKYYIQSSKQANSSNATRVCHRDEFIRCTVCNKERRIRLRTREECRSFHNALTTSNWKCSDMPHDKVSCEDEEERGSRRVYRGCSRSPTCRGCTTCVCFGCQVCRFPDCTCQACIDFTRNVKP